MKKNRLYSITKGMLPLFGPKDENLFGFAGTMNQGIKDIQASNTAPGVTQYSSNPYSNVVRPQYWTPVTGNIATGYKRMEASQFFNRPLVLTPPTSTGFSGSLATGNTSTATPANNTASIPTSASVTSTPPVSASDVSKVVNAVSNSSSGEIKGGGKDVSGSGSSSGSTAGAAASIAAGAILGMADKVNTGDRRGLWDTLDPGYNAGKTENGHLETTAGNVLSDIGIALTSGGAQGAASGAGAAGGYVALAGAALKVIGDVINNGWGTATNQEKLAIANKANNYYNNFYSNVENMDDIALLPSFQTVKNPYSGGVFKKGWENRKNTEFMLDQANAKSWAQRSVENNIRNILNNRIGRQLADDNAHPSAYGGFLGYPEYTALGIMQNDKFLTAIDNRSDAISNKNNVYGLGAYTGGAKTFDDGGQLKAAFLDDFSTDPIGAAVRYNRGIEQLQAQREAEAAAAQQASDYAAIQQRLTNLETRNRGLEAIAASLDSPSTGLSADLPVNSPTDLPSSSIPSAATPRVSSGNSNWDYIEDQLRRSGKFNDIQIEGIKYNLQRESGIGMYDGGDNGTARGLAQWRGERVPKDMSLEGQTQYLIDTLSNYDGKLHWIGKKNYEGFMNARTPEEAHYYIARGYERPAQRIVDKVKRDSDMSLGRLRAFGGELGTNGTDWYNGLLQVNEGGTHEDNPLDGVPMGLDPEGIPNLVEEGETIYNDYVFSDRMMVPDFMYKELGLGGVIKRKGRKGMSFADASKKLAQESEQRPNDPISQDGLKASLTKLAEVQETERMRKQAEDYMGLQEYACGGRLGNRFDLGGLAWLQKNHPELTSNKAAIARVLENMMQKNKSNFYRNGKWDFDAAWGTINHPKVFTSDEDAFNSWVSHGLDKRIAFGLTHKMPKEPKNSDLKVEYDRKIKARAEAYNRLVRGSGKPSTTPTQQVSQQTARKEAYPGPLYDAPWALGMEGTPDISYDFSKPRIPSTFFDQVNDAWLNYYPVDRYYGPEEGTPYDNRSAEPKAPKQETVVKQNYVGKAEERGTTTQAAQTRTPAQGSQRGDNKARGAATTSKGGKTLSDLDYGLRADIAFDPHEDEVRAAAGFGSKPAVTEEQRQAIAMDGYKPETMQESIDAITGEYAGQRGLQDYYKPYPTWMRYAPAFGAGLMSLTDVLGLTNKPDYTYADKLEAAANNAGKAPHIDYNPIGDYLRYNPMDIWFEQNRLDANARATDRALLNTSSPSKAAALLASGYNSQIASGDLYRKALEYNDAQKQQVADFNRRTNMFNSQMGLEADMANARYRQQAQSLGLSGLAQAAGLRDQIDARIGAAKAANLSNFFNSLGDIGRENFAMNMIDSTSAAHNGYTIGRNGRVRRHNPDGTVSAFGGKIKKHNK